MSLVSQADKIRTKSERKRQVALEPKGTRIPSAEGLHFYMGSIPLESERVPERHRRSIVPAFILKLSRKDSS